MDRLLQKLRQSACSFIRGERGNIAITAAIFLPVAIGVAAVAVDTGAIYLERRHAQNIVDLTAISVASNLRNAERNARRMLAANGYENVSISVGKWDGKPDRDVRLGNRTALLLELGRYKAEAALDPGDRFVPGPVSAPAAGNPAPSLRSFPGAWFSGSLRQKTGSAVFPDRRTSARIRGRGR